MFDFNASSLHFHKSLHYSQTQTNSGNVENTQPGLDWIALPRPTFYLRDPYLGRDLHFGNYCYRYSSCTM